MPKVAKIILWAIAGFLMLAIAIVLMAYAKQMSYPRVAYDSYGEIDMEESMDYARSTGLSAPQAGGMVKSFVKSMSVDASPQMENAVMPDVDDGAERLVIKTGNLSMVVTDVRETIKNVSEFAMSQNGYVVSSNVYKRGLAPYGTVTIKIPAVNFDEGLNEVKTFGEVVSDSVNGQDVTEEYSDLNSQLRNLEATEKQFLTILYKAVKVEDILAVQRELTQVRGNIERLQGRIKYLKQSSDMSTISVNLSTDPDVLPSVDSSKTWKPWAEVKQAARSVVEIGKSIVNMLIWLVVFVPVWVLGALIVWVVVRAVKKIKSRRKSSLN